MTKIHEAPKIPQPWNRREMLAAANRMYLAALAAAGNDIPT